VCRGGRNVVCRGGSSHIIIECGFCQSKGIYLGFPSPCLRGLVGAHIPCGQSAGAGRVCDAYGHHLDCATLPGGTWEDQHDDVAETVMARVLGAGIPGRREPRDIFTAVLPVEALQQRDGLSGSGIIPDGVFRGVDFASRPHAQRAPRPAGADVLVDFKMLHLGVARYTSVAAQTQRAAAVASRARAVHTDYQLMARQRDERHHHVGARAVAAGHLAPGPVLALMQSYGTIRGLVFGAYAEASPDVHCLLEHTATHEARLRWEEMGARRYQEARARTLSSLYADWGMAAARAAARMRLQRVRFVGLTRAQVRLVARVGGAGPRPPMAEAAVGDYAMMQGAFMHPAGGAFAASA
jgi:hypothetical protein